MPGGIGPARPDHHLEQRRHVRARHCRAADPQAGPQDHLLASASAQFRCVRACVSRWRGGIGMRAAGHAGRTAARRGRGAGAVLHAHRLRHRTGRGPSPGSDRRRGLRAGASAARRLRADPRPSGRPLGQPDVPARGAQLQPGYVHGRRPRHRAGRRGRAAGRVRARAGHDARHLREIRGAGGGLTCKTSPA
ncbi:hypothetical protein G6F31_018313 [Rhizopus arrhizus]|nr:hypothetical protein G6F31_018313 [Rhizopus arrhizus]